MPCVLRACRSKHYHCKYQREAPTSAPGFACSRTITPGVGGAPASWSEPLLHTHRTSGEFFCGDRFMMCGQSGRDHICNCSAENRGTHRSDVRQALARPPVWTHKKANVSVGVEGAVMLTRAQIAFVRDHLFHHDTELVRRVCGTEAFRQVDHGPALEA
jgi:hypothetical protein